VIELALIVCRLVQYVAASVLMGSTLFFIYALPAHGPGSAAELRWPRPLLAAAAILLAIATLVGLVTQTAELAGSLSDALTAESLGAVVTQMDLGKAALARAALALAAVFCVTLVRFARGSWLTCGVLGTLACATFGWAGHGLATDGAGHWLHLGADVIHALAAAGWIGALVAFVALAFPRNQDFARLSVVATALQRFSPIGVSLVATLVVSGLINTWFLVGADVVGALHDPYGQFLALKLALFAGMLALAALHRQRSVPALVARVSSRTLPQADALAALRRSIAAEALIGLAVLAVVAWLGTLPPPAAM
jgi:putative copper resistance protein D